MLNYMALRDRPAASRSAVNTTFGVRDSAGARPLTIDRRTAGRPGMSLNVLGLVALWAFGEIETAQSRNCAEVMNETHGFITYLPAAAMM